MNICVFGSSSEQIDKIYLESAEHLGKKIAEKGHSLVFGAGKYGVMGASARGAYSAGGYTIGVTPDFFIDVGVVFDKCSELIVTDTMRERKGIMEDKADAFVICAGGMGTLEEFFEVLTLKQLNRHTKPIIIYNVKGYYNSMLAMLDNAVSEKFMTNACNRLYTIADTEEEVFNHGSYYCGRILCNDFRAEDFFDAAQYHAGSDFSAKGRGNRSLDWLYCQGDTGDGTAVCSGYGTSVLP